MPLQLQVTQVRVPKKQKSSHFLLLLLVFSLTDLSNIYKMMKLVLKLELHDDKAKKKVMRTVSGFPGVESISMEQKDQKLTVTGDVDPVIIVAKLRKFCHTDLITAGPAKEPEKKKQEPAKKPEDNTTKDIIMPGFYNHHPHMMPSFYVRSYEEDPTNGCVIC